MYLGEDVMRFVTTLFAGLMVVSGAAFVCSPSQAAKLSKADKIALKEATIACKAEARGKKVKLLARRKFVNTCVAKALKGHPSIDALQLSRERRDIQRLPLLKPAEWGCPSSC
jgi:hypothetical protein